MTSDGQHHLLISENERFSPKALAVLEEKARVTSADLDRASLMTAVRTANTLWIRLRHRIDREVMDAAPDLRFIVTPTTGLNHVDLAAAQARGIRVLSLKGRTEFLRRVCATAEHTVGLMLALMRGVPAAVNHVREGGWNRDPFRGRELDGKTCGIVGFGRLGRLVAGYLEVFGVRVIAADKPGLEIPTSDNVTLMPLGDLLTQADIVSLHVDYSPENHGFFGDSQFALMKPGAFFINTARGELVDEAALLHWLQSGRPGGAALDVLAGEDSGGMADHPLVRYAQTANNLLITPHIGGCTYESMSKTEEFMADLWCEALGTPSREKEARQ